MPVPDEQLVAPVPTLSCYVLSDSLNLNTAKSSLVPYYTESMQVATSVSSFAKVAVSDTGEDVPKFPKSCVIVGHPLVVWAGSGS